MESQIAKQIDPKFVFNEKRKWQIALRRYVLLNIKCVEYAPYFGIDAAGFRKWIETQFDEDTNWENFSKAWQFDHIVPVAFFDLTDEEELKLCWNFTNIRIDKSLKNKKTEQKVDILAAKFYFLELYHQSGYECCKKIAEKLEKLERAAVAGSYKQQQFLKENSQYLEQVSTFSAYEFYRLNSGEALETIINEKKFLEKYG